MSEPHTDSERLARLETEVEGMRAQFGSRFNSLESKIDVLTTSVSDGRKPRWDTWAAWLAVGVTLFGGGAWAIDRRFSDSESRADRNYQLASSALNQVGTHEARISERLGEIETQFRTGGQIYNHADHLQMMLIDQLWRKEFGQSLRDDTPWPILGKER